MEAIMKGIKFNFIMNRYWRNDTANGKGRLIHGDGDIYEG
tara:strand:- start:617 stop:736 length:120 start_codon:yes stop_codon:yes gene_type:complete